MFWQVFSYLLYRGSQRDDFEVETHVHPLHIASGRGDLEILKECNKFYEEFDILDNEGRSPVHYAAANNQIFSMEFFVKKECDINRQDMYDISWLN